MVNTHYGQNWMQDGKAVTIDADLTLAGANTHSGALTVSGALTASAATTTSGQLNVGDLLVVSQTAQTLSGAGAVDITSTITHVVTTGTDALTLADGAEGQIKIIVMKTDGGDGTLTPSNLGNGSTITFDDVGDSALLVFTNASWHMFGGTATLA